MKDLRRPSFDEYFMAIANVIRTRSTCNRRAYGAVIVKDRKIVSTGYHVVHVPARERIFHPNTHAIHEGHHCIQ
jgi:deoxycytidylate deaminase